jgi:hypothetical protein
VLGADWVRELPWRDRADVRAVELERPAWLRELGQPPTTVKGQRPYWQTVERVQQYRECRAIADPDRPLGPEPVGRDRERRRHHRITRQALGRLRQ